MATLRLFAFFVARAPAACASNDYPRKKCNMLRVLRQVPALAEQRARDYFAEGPVRRALWRLGSNLIDHNATRTASAMAFDLFLALIPALALAGWVLAHV